MDKNQIKSKLMELLNIELDFSGLDETDLDFQNYIIKEYGITNNNNKFQPTCLECNKKVTDKIYVAFELNKNNYKDYKPTYAFLDEGCLFEHYVLKIIIKRIKK